ncbi:MAG: hypothetical protein RBT15_00550 [Gudongella sp.]|jgi:hypothetical protein|nr:hypothetical protein [Gudongella sp.]
MKPYYKKIGIFMIGLLFLVLSFNFMYETKDSCLARPVAGKGDYLFELKGWRWEEYAKELIVYSLEGTKKEVYSRNISALNPWKLASGDVTGDGQDEISIGVYKESPLHPVMAKRPFIYGFNGKDILPVWRGSRLSRPFEDYLIIDIDNDGISEIVASEYLDNGNMVINSYKWKGFGFEGYLESSELDLIAAINESNGRVIVDGVLNGEDFRAHVGVGSEMLEWEELQ